MAHRVNHGAHGALAGFRGSWRSELRAAATAAGVALENLAHLDEAPRVAPHVPRTALDPGWRERITPLLLLWYPRTAWTLGAAPRHALTEPARRPWTK